jgi:opacity protein-like surface antigen
MKTSMRGAAVAAAFLLTAMSPSFAQTTGSAGKPHGLHLGLNLNGSLLDYEHTPAESGVGLGFRAGYGPGPALSFFVGIDVADMKAQGADPPYELGHAELGVRYNLHRLHPRWTPYADVAYATRFMMFANVMIDDRAVDLDYNAYGLSLGGGVQYYVGAPMSIDLGLRWMGGRFSEVEYGGRTYDLGSDSFAATSIRVNAGVSWYPLAGRSARTKAPPPDSWIIAGVR